MPSSKQGAFTNLDKVLWPDDGFTKGDLIEYYRSVAKWLVPHLFDRPLTLQRYPDGIDGKSFFEKSKPRFAPEWVQTTTVSAYQNTGTIEYIVCNDEATLLWCANLAAIVLHIWTSRVNSLDSPDFVFFDLDPWEGCTLKTLAQVALAFRDGLEPIGLYPLVKTSGGSGLHVVVPLKAGYDYDTIKQFAEISARHVATVLPKATTLERSIARRPKDTVYLDYVQVGRGKTLVPPYGVRARAKAPVSMPLSWTEIELLARSRTKDPADALSRWNIKNAHARLMLEGDLWAGKHWREAKIEPALKKARSLWA
ncbi:MAG: non-homologous end-joining DNA ligase [Candidatus Eremiobacteraeota bacterium]|nr:non-homologous end-joining DNA ligase [Candidatus Eremiobacteraeota bacterium]